MANIMLTEICNLKCPYCFANEFVNQKKSEISIENLKKALDFITADGTDRVGLIGGEPTLHSRFDEILELIIADDRIRHVKVFTNGVRLAEHIPLLSNEKFDLIINCNEPEDIGEINSQAIYNALKIMVNDYDMKNKIVLGYNIYRDTQSYEFLLKMLREFHFHNVRMAVTVPNIDGERQCDNFRKHKELLVFLKLFIFTMLDNYVIPHYDCNKVPECIWDSSDRKRLDEIFNKLPERIKIKEMKNDDISVFFERVTCEPVVDIRTDLTAVRCFGLSSCTKESINDFRNLGDLRQHYFHIFDSVALAVSNSSECKYCCSRKELKCNGGCYVYSLDKMLN